MHVSAYDWTEGGNFWEVGVTEGSNRESVLGAHDSVAKGKQSQRLV
jgi:TPP-dependent trihydroxycyclohexane-1,2-dione (THcHDO) dehydratase